MDASKLVFLVLVIPCFFLVGFRLYCSVIAWLHTLLIKRAIRSLVWAYEGETLSSDEAQMMAVVQKLTNGEIEIRANSDNLQGAYHEIETSRPVFLVPRYKLLLVEISLDLLAPFLASEMMDFVNGAKSTEATITGTLKHYESGIRAFIKLKKKGYNFRLNTKLLEEWNEEARIYQGDREEWLNMTRTLVLTHFPELIHAPD